MSAAERPRDPGAREPGARDPGARDPEGQGQAPREQRRVRVAVLCNVLTPYRVHAHRRIARELPEVELFTLLTHDEPDQPWSLRPPAEINPVPFGAGEAFVGSPKVSRRAWRKGGEVCRWLAAQRADAVVVCGYNDVTRLRVILWCRARGLPAALFTDGNIASDRARGLRLLLKRAYLAPVLRCFRVLMPCGTLGAAMLRRYGADPARTVFWPYEPDEAPIRAATPEQARAAITALGLDPARRRLLVCARLTRVKRIDLAIDAFARIAAERPDWDLVIAGDGPLRDALRARVPEALCPRVVFAGFVGDANALAALYRGCHALCVPSDYEPWALVVHEACAAGLAVVSTDVVGAAAELVRDGVNGRVVPAGDVNALSAALLGVTDAARIDTLRAASPGMIDAWRARGGDPVVGLRRALEKMRLLPPPRG